MALIDKYNFEHLKNEAETMVFREMERQLNEYQETICLCNECVVDMAAIALNTVKPLYRFSLLGTLYAASLMDEENYAKGVKEAVHNAIEKVRENPSHETQDA